MSLDVPQKFKSFDEVSDYIQSMFNKIGLDDLRATGLRQEAPTSETLEKGRHAVAEISGVPFLYYHTTAGVLYKWQGTPA